MLPPEHFQLCQPPACALGLPLGIHVLGAMQFDALWIQAKQAGNEMVRLLVVNNPRLNLLNLRVVAREAPQPDREMSY